MIVHTAKGIKMAKHEKTCMECGRTMDSNIYGTGSINPYKLKDKKIVIDIDQYEDKEQDERLSRTASKSGYAKNNKEPKSSKPSKSKKDPVMDVPKKKKPAKRK
jgi:hypothetical protein